MDNYLKKVCFRFHDKYLNEIAQTRDFDEFLLAIRDFPNSLDVIRAGEEFYNALQQVPSDHALHQFDTIANNFRFLIQNMERMNPLIFIERDARHFEPLEDLLNEVKGHEYILDIGKNIQSMQNNLHSAFGEHG